MIIPIILMMIIATLIIYAIIYKNKFRQDSLDKYYKDFIREKDSKFISFKRSILDIELPVIKMTINGKRYGFMLDSGANWNFVDESFIKEISKAIPLRLSEGGNWTSATNTKNKSQTVTLPLMYNNIKFEEKFAVADMEATFSEATKNSKIKIHGVLGNEFMQKYRWKLDFDRMVVSLY